MKTDTLLNRKNPVDFIIWKLWQFFDKRVDERSEVYLKDEFNLINYDFWKLPKFGSFI